MKKHYTIITWSHFVFNCDLQFISLMLKKVYLGKQNLSHSVPLRNLKNKNKTLLTITVQHHNSLTL